MLGVMILAAIAACMAEPLVMLHRPSLTNKMPGSGNIDTTLTRYVIECARKCSGFGACRSVFYVRDTGECQTHSVVYTTASPGLFGTASTVYYEKGTGECQTHSVVYTAASPGLFGTASTVYYEKGAATTSTPTSTTTTTATTTSPQPTTTTPTTATLTTTTSAAPTTTTPCTIPPPFECPVDAVGVKEMWLPDCTLVKVRVFADTTRTFPDAKAKCEAEGGQLYQITTTVKMEFSLNLMRCPAYVSMEYLIDAVYNTDTGVWETSDGTPLPMTQGDFWYTDRPNNPGVTNCINMQLATFNFLWDDTSCTLPYMAICDMP